MTTDEAAAILRRAWAHVEGEGDTFARVLTREHRGEWLAWVGYDADESTPDASPYVGRGRTEAAAVRDLLAVCEREARRTAHYDRSVAHGKRVEANALDDHAAEQERAADALREALR